jgi:hypothetical protein
MVNLDSGRAEARYAIDRPEAALVVSDRPWAMSGQGESPPKITRHGAAARIKAEGE